MLSLRTVQSLIHKEYSQIEEGTFRFDQLEEHLAKYNAPKAVAVAEDATRIIGKVEYDPTTNRCVGFVLPTNNDGLPKVDEHQAVQMEEMFKITPVSKYARMYVAQPLKSGVPSFCLACIGTDNKFTATEVLLRWKYICHQLKKRGIRVISMASDGDSRLMCAMRTTLGFYSNKTDTPNHLSNTSSHVSIPKTLTSWTCKTSLPSILCVQDIVHLGVKRKARL